MYLVPDVYLFYFISPYFVIVYLSYHIDLVKTYTMPLYLSTNNLNPKVYGHYIQYAHFCDEMYVKSESASCQHVRSVPRRTEWIIPEPGDPGILPASSSRDRFLGNAEWKMLTFRTG